METEKIIVLSLIDELFSLKLSCNVSFDQCFEGKNNVFEEES
jgi:hypothetical protein